MIDIAAAVLAAAGSSAVLQWEVAAQTLLTYQAFDGRSSSYGWRSLLFRCLPHMPRQMTPD